MPPDRGAIFAAALSDGAFEPEVLVFQSGRQVASGPTGRRIVVAPGQYRIHVGSGPMPTMVTEDVTVAAGRTAAASVRWGGLRVLVVDENGVPHEGSSRSP